MCGIIKSLDLEMNVFAAKRGSLGKEKLVKKVLGKYELYLKR